jgi:hypothetical protein
MAGFCFRPLTSVRLTFAALTLASNETRHDSLTYFQLVEDGRVFKG